MVLLVVLVIRVDVMKLLLFFLDCLLFGGVVCCVGGVVDGLGWLVCDGW